MPMFWSFVSGMSIDKALITNLDVDPTTPISMTMNPLPPAAYRFLDGDDDHFSPRYDS